MKQKLFVLVLAILASTEVLFAVQIGDFRYEIKNNTAIVSSYYGGSANTVTIPSTINYTYYNSILGKNITDTYPVVGINSGAFDEETKVTSIIVPNSVTSIGDHAFSNVPNVMYSGSATGAPWGAKCINGTTEGWLVFTDETKTQLVACNSSASGEITIPNSVVSIGQNAFYECTQITSFNIGTGLETVGTNAFEYCWNLTSVTIHSNAFMNAGRSMADIFEYCPIAEYILGEEITSIGNFAFGACDNLTSINISGNNVTSIGLRAFSGCTNLTAITIPENVTYIGDGAFNECSRLQSIIIPNNVISLGKEAFYECDSLKYAIIGDGVTEVGERAFEYCYNIDSVVIGNSVKKIGVEAFDECRNLSSLTFGNSLDTIQSYAFDGCSKLKSLEFPSSLKYIGDDAFDDCTLNSATFHNGVSLTNEDTFGFIDTLNVYMTDSTRSYRSLFGYLTDIYRRRNAPNVNIMQGSTCIERDVFMREYASWPNKSLERITIPASVAYIPDSCFMNCVNLREVVIGLLEAKGEENASDISRRVKLEDITEDSVDDEIVTEGSTTTVGKCALQNCTSLQSLTFESNVREIGAAACVNCTSLSHIEFNRGIKIIQGNAFNGCPIDQPLIFPEGLESIGANAFLGCPIPAVTFPNSLKTIGENAFDGCGLREVTLPASITSLGYAAFANNPLTYIDMKCSTLACQDYGGFYFQFGGCTKVEIVKIKMMRNEENSIRTPGLNGTFGIFGNGSIQNWKTLEFYEGSTYAGVGDNKDNSDMPNLTTLKLASTIEIIGPYSFHNTINLEKVTLPSSLTKVGYNAFEGSGLKKIITYAPQPTAENKAFADRIHNTTLKCEDPAKETWYQAADVWKDFFTYNNADNTPTSLSSNEVLVNTQSNAATVSYPATYGSAFSELTAVSQETGEESAFEFHFGSAFELPQKRSIENRVGEENPSNSIPGYSFTIQGLTPNTTYDYNISLYDKDEILLEEFTGTFTTQADETTVLDQIGQETVADRQKILCDGQILILRGEKTYTITGQEVK